jgi:ABC-type Fe3+/spermidine/putrescine transport system ATPase subunit
MPDFAAGLTVTDLHKAYGAIRALDGASFEAPIGQVLALLGPSGCGKSTALALIAGLERPDRGRIAWQGSDLASVPPHRRGFGVMFQDYALFPHLSVFENVAFGLRMAGETGAALRGRVGEALELVGLLGYERRDTSLLSGGEQQRVALARALAPRPPLLMLDEPLGALDRTLRERLLDELRGILRASPGGRPLTAVYVTHDQEEAFGLADRVVVLNAGRVEQAGTPQAIYLRPESAFVARFLGLQNLLEGEFQPGSRPPLLETAAGPLELPARTALKPGQRVTALLRPDAMHLGEPGRGRLVGTLVERVFQGAGWRGVVVVNGVRLSFTLQAARLPELGETVVLAYDPEEAVQLIPR